MTLKVSIMVMLLSLNSFLAFSADITNVECVKSVSSLSCESSRNGDAFDGMNAIATCSAQVEYLLKNGESISEEIIGSGRSDATDIEIIAGLIPGILSAGLTLKGQFKVHSKIAKTKATNEILAKIESGKCEDFQNNIIKKVD